ILNKYSVTKPKFSEYKDTLEILILDCLEKEFTFGPGQFITYIEKALTGGIVKILTHNNHLSSSELNLNMLPKRMLDNFKGMDDEYIENEKRVTLKQALAKLETNERTFVYRRYGFNGPPLSLVQLKDLYYHHLTLEELANLESTILNKLRQDEKIKTI
ncbi:MAG: hypothetical protein PHI22_04770, partial [Bacilli bacterium]|nr:hypothetical protein [Bacilli bacterium]